MRVLTRAPINQPLVQMEIGDSLKALQDLVGGYITPLHIGGGVTCLCAEDSTLLGDEDSNNNFYHDIVGWILGNCVFCGTIDGEFASLTSKQIAYVADYIGFPIVMG